MKKIILVLFLTILACNLDAQNSWVTLLQDTGLAVKMIRSVDNEYIALAQLPYPVFGYGYSKLGLYKCNSTGAIEWSSYMDTGDSAFIMSSSIYSFGQNTDIIQLSNGNYFITGQYKSRPFLAMFNQNGDSLWFKRFDNLPYNYYFKNPIEKTTNIIWVVGPGQLTNRSYIYKFDLYGNILDTTEIPVNHYINKMIKVNNDTLLFTTIHGNFTLTDTNLTIIEHLQYNFNPSIIRKNYFNSGYIIMGNKINYLPTDTNVSGFVLLNSALDSLRFVSSNQYYGYRGSLLTRDFIIFDEDEIAICGGMYWYYQFLPFLIKTDLFGNSSIIQAYLGVVPQFAVNILKEDDSSFIMYQYRDETPRRIFIVRTNADGTVNSELYNVEKKEIKVYPNPVNEQLTVELPLHFTGSLEMFSISGEKLHYTDINNSSTLSIDMKKYKPGNYILRIFYAKNKLFTEQIIKY
ncbi:MAG: T9SS type A sorting domain-containing protein [Bacteroidia bacterium]|nr:T9SS type A sorting domain-containing protein [Bacteroidia bacterium]